MPTNKNKRVEWSLDIPEGLLKLYAKLYPTKLTELEHNLIETESWDFTIETDIMFHFYEIGTEVKFQVFNSDTFNDGDVIITMPTKIYHKLIGPVQADVWHSRKASKHSTLQSNEVENLLY